jgi:alginate production protein
MKLLKLNPFVQAGIGLSFALLWSCPTLAALTESKNFGLEVKITGQSEDDRDLGTQRGGDVNGVGLDLRPWIYGESGAWSAYAMAQAVTSTDIIETDTLQQSDDATQQTDSGDREAKKSYLAMREFWIGYRGLTQYPGEQLKFGRQRLRNDDGQWRDTNIEALNWTFDTTLLRANLGVAERFSEYRTDLKELSPQDEDRMHVYGDVGYQWMPGQWAGIRAHHSHDNGSLDYPIPGQAIDTLDKTQNGDLTWLGLEANSDAYNWRNTNTVNYWASVTGMTGDRDTVNPLNADGTRPAQLKRSDDVDGWATDLGIRLRLDPQWQVGALMPAPARTTNRTACKATARTSPAPARASIVSAKPSAAKWPTPRAPACSVPGSCATNTTPAWCTTSSGASTATRRWAAMASMPCKTTPTT